MDESGRILLADDEETFLQSTADLLRQNGYQCVCVPDAGMAVEKLRTEDYDLLIADIKMSGNAELELIRDMSHIAEGMPVILVTGYPTVHSAIQSIQLPVIAYLVKPPDFNELLQCVRISVERYHTYKAVCGTYKRLQEWIQELEKIKILMCKPATDASSISTSSFLDLTLHNIISALWELKPLADATALNNGRQAAPGLTEPIKSDMYMETLREAISVLEKTKSAFKSKDLGRLRKRLEEAIKS